MAIINPTFSEYRRSAELNNLDIIDLELDLENNFKLNIDIIKENIKDLIVYLYVILIIRVVMSKI